MLISHVNVFTDETEMFHFMVVIVDNELQLIYSSIRKWAKKSQAKEKKMLDGNQVIEMMQFFFFLKALLYWDPLF